MYHDAESTHRAAHLLPLLARALGFVSPWTDIYPQTVMALAQFRFVAWGIYAVFKLR
jgi:hypothetical protein